MFIHRVKENQLSYRSDIEDGLTFSQDATVTGHSVLHGEIDLGLELELGSLYSRGKVDYVIVNYPTKGVSIKVY